MSDRKPRPVTDSPTCGMCVHWGDVDSRHGAEKQCCYPLPLWAELLIGIAPESPEPWRVSGTTDATSCASFEWEAADAPTE